MAKIRTVIKPKTAPLRKSVKTQPKKTVKAHPSKTPEKIISKPEKVTFSPNLKCSFCGKSIKKARRLIALETPSKISICDVCVEVCILQLLEDSPEEWATRITRIFSICLDKIEEQTKQNKIKPKTKARPSKKK